jgi:hypothetical protein
MSAEPRSHIDLFADLALVARSETKPRSSPYRCGATDPENEHHACALDYEHEASSHAYYHPHPATADCGVDGCNGRSWPRTTKERIMRRQTVQAAGLRVTVELTGSGGERGMTGFSRTWVETPDGEITEYAYAGAAKLPNAVLDELHAAFCRACAIWRPCNCGGPPLITLRSRRDR